MRTISRRKKKTQPRERTATPAELEDDHARWIRAKTAAADRDTTGGAATEGAIAAGTAADRANIRAHRLGLKRTANMVAMPSMVDLVFGDASSGSAPFANDNGVTS